MNLRRFYTGKAVGFIVVIIAVGIFFFFNNYIYQEKQDDGTTREPYRAALTGEYVCLPHKDKIKTECEPGIKTDVGEYYAVNFYLMSQTHDPLEVGQRFSANGTISSSKTLSAAKWQQFNMEGIFSVTDSVNIIQVDDMSSVKATTFLGGSVTAKGVTISPQEIISDSRCPNEVQCVWAGTVEIRTTLSTQVSHGEHILELGKPQLFGEYNVTLIEVTPTKKEGTFLDDDYRFTFEVTQTRPE